MASNHARLPQRRTLAQRVKVDENTNSRLLRPTTNVVTTARYPAKDIANIVKPSQPRQALGEVSKVAVNRKENAIAFPSKDKEEIGLKRGRSNSTTIAQRVPLGPSRNQVAHPTAQVAQARAPSARPRASVVAQKITTRHAPQPKVLHEENEYRREIPTPVNNMIADGGYMLEAPSDRVPEMDKSAEQEVEAMVDVDDSEDEDEDDLGHSSPEAQPVRFWPEVSPEEALHYRKEVEAVRERFEDSVSVQDTSLVSEYADDIFDYMGELEEEMMPNPTYMDGQNEISWPMRQKLVDWLLQVHLRYHMLPETLWIAVNIVDRFLSKRVVSLLKLQLVGVTAMFIAAKYEEILAPSVDEFVFMTDGGYTKEEILKGERIVLQTLDFRVSQYCSPYSWMRKISRADDYDIQTRTLSKFLTEVTLLDHRFLRAKPSLVAAVGMYSARRMLGGDWGDAFINYSGYTEVQLLPGHELLVEKILEPGFERQYVFKKYAHKKFLKASLFAMEWAQNTLSDDDVPGSTRAQ